jgi:hypothetical protein
MSSIIFVLRFDSMMTFDVKLVAQGKADPDEISRENRIGLHYITLTPFCNNKISFSGGYSGRPKMVITILNP